MRAQAPASLVGECSSSGRHHRVAAVLPDWRTAPINRKMRPSVSELFSQPQDFPDRVAVKLHELANGMGIPIRAFVGHFIDAISPDA
jgi:hypothetical protein